MLDVCVVTYVHVSWPCSAAVVCTCRVAGSRRMRQCTVWLRASAHGSQHRHSQRTGQNERAGWHKLSVSISVHVFSLNAQAHYVHWHCACNIHSKFSRISHFFPMKELIKCTYLEVKCVGLSSSTWNLCLVPRKNTLRRIFVFILMTYDVIVIVGMSSPNWTYSSSTESCNTSYIVWRLQSD